MLEDGDPDKEKGPKGKAEADAPEQPLDEAPPLLPPPNAPPDAPPWAP